MRNQNVVALLILLALASCAFLYSRTFFNVPGQSKNPDTFVGTYSLVLKSLDGKDVHLYEYRRKVLIAYSWASWCTYCREELKNLAKLHQTYGDNIHIVAINRAESAVEAKAYADRLAAESSDINPTALVDILLDPGDEFFKSISGYAMPETVFINEQGDIIFHQRGPIKIEEVDEKIKELLK